MRPGDLFWGIILVLLGGLYLLSEAGYLTGDVFGWFWPMFFMAAGVWVLVGGFRSRRETPADQSFVISLGGAREAMLTLNHGVGRVELEAGADNDALLTGSSARGMHHTVQRLGDRLEVTIDAGPSILPFIGPEGGAWRYQLNPDVPLQLTVHAGASDLDIDLAELRVTRFSFDGGASSLNLTLPRRAELTAVNLHVGATSVNLHVPQGVAARLRAAGSASMDVDEGRFPRLELGKYESPDYDTAPYRADISMDGGAASIRVS